VSGLGLGGERDGVGVWIMEFGVVGRDMILFETAWLYLKTLMRVFAGHDLDIHAV
jgi:hypothetical protein